MKKHALCLVIFFSFGYVNAQHSSLIHSGTLYDSFENPVQAAFTKEKSNKYAINLLLPSFGANLKFKGDAETQLKNLIYGNEIEGTGIAGVNNFNHINASLNMYLIMFKIYHTADYNREIGFSLQLRNEGDFEISNSALVIPTSYKSFSRGIYSDFYNNKFDNQSFYQLGISYRENYNQRWAFGGKLSFLSGITYTKTNISSSTLDLRENDYYASFTGTQVSSYGTDTFGVKTFIPGIKNPGAAISLGSSFTSKKGLYVTAHLKDLGFIRWNKSTPTYQFNDELSVRNLNDTVYKGRFRLAYDSLLNRNASTGKHTTYLRSKFEMAVSKKFGNYKPVAVANYEMFDNNYQFSLLNNYRYRALNFGLNAFYESQSGFNFGGLFMIKSPNTEFYFGTEKLMPTYYIAKGYLSKDPNIGKSPTYLNVFFGLTLKFGRKVQSMGQADWVDGLNDEETGFIYRMGKKEKRAAQKENSRINSRRKATNKRNN
jgi:hypothetical protein